MTVTLSENVSDTLTNRVWDEWKNTGIRTELTWLELHRLAERFLKICREQEHDYREFDFYTLIDSNLNYYENVSLLDEAISQPQSEVEKEAASKLKDYLTEEKLKEYSTQEKTVIDEIASKNQTLDKRIKQIAKAQESQVLDTEEIKKEIQQVKTDIISELSKIPDLREQVEALMKSKTFNQLGLALKPMTATQPPQPKPKRQITFPSWLKPKKPIKLLDALAGAFTTAIWCAATGWITQSFQLSYGLVIGLGVFWLGFIVVFRLMIGGILD